MSRFRLAVVYARKCMKDPESTAWYISNPKKGKSVYRLAIKDYLNPPVIEKIITQDYKGVPGDKIVIIAKDDFEVVKVILNLTDAKGKLIEQGECVPDALRSVWVYKATAKLSSTKGVTITATAYDRPDNTGEGSLTLA